MGLGGIDSAFHKQGQSQKSTHHEPKVSFQSHLESKLEARASAIHAAEETQKQSLMKAKRKKIQDIDTESTEEESVIKTVKELKKKLKKLHDLENEL